MIPRFRAFLFAVVATAPALSAVPLAAQQKAPLDHSVYDGWNRISAQAISNDGRWVLYRLTPGLGDSELHVRNVESGQAFEVDRANAARFSQDSRFVVFEIQPGDSIVKDLRVKKTKSADLPKDSLGILDLAGGTITRVERVKSFAMPAEAGGWVAYLLEAPPKEASDSSETEGRQGGDVVGQQAQSDDDDDDEKKEEGTQLVVRNLATGAESRFDDVTTFAFAKNGSRLAYMASNEEGDADGAFVLTPGSDTAEPLMVGKGVYKNLAFDDEGNQVAFLSNRADFDADQPAFALYRWEHGDDEASAVADSMTRGVPTGWWVSENGTPSFSENGKRLFFGTAPRPAPDPEEEVPEWEKVELDVWNWKDPLLQPNQLVQREQELQRTYRAMVDLDDNRVVQLATINMPTVTVADSGNGDIALAVTNMPYRQRISWDSPGYNDVYVVDVSTGRARIVLEDIQASARLSPAGKYITWWDGHKSAWFAKDIDGGEAVNLTGAIPYPFYNELHDRPMIPGSNGSAGWTDDDERFLVYDKHDIWAVDPTGRAAPRNITEGFGRRENLRLRYVALDRAGGFVGFGGFGGGVNVIANNEDIVLSAFDLTTKSSGFYRDRVRGEREPRRIVMEPLRFGTPQKAKDSDVMIFTRESFREFPDLWSSDLNLDGAQRLSHANPQQDNYLWGSAELVDWTSTDGLPLQGLLYKPDNFDPNRKYPMMVYYYEKNSDQLHRHRAPSPGSSSINISWYVSRGYVVFIPDIFYRDGYPGESALNCLVPGVLSLIAQGFIDPDRVGAQGHSWGGYQNAYLVTRTNIFAAVEAGAPVSNMTSAYGGIRWQSGRSRAMQYEKTQSRMGGSLWEARPRYIENSPVFWADKVETPVLMMHNDEDGAVPWYQGIEFFVALRRLHQPVWMLNYNGEAHGLRKYQNRKDFAVRMQQFFDHYLMGAPAPVWMEEGIPAVKKGKDLGLRIVTKTATSGGGR